MIAKYYNVKIKIMLYDNDGASFNTTQYGKSDDKITSVLHFKHFTLYVGEDGTIYCCKYCLWFSKNKPHVCNQVRVFNNIAYGKIKSF